MVEVINDSCEAFADYVKRQRRTLYFWGAGVMMQICLSYVIRTHDLYRHVVMSADVDPKKIGQQYFLGPMQVTVYSPDDMMRQAALDKKAVIVIASSYFHEILHRLDEMPSLDGCPCFIAPLMYLEHPANAVMELSPTANVSIPKTIHYCWFGDKPIDEKGKRCIESWQKYCPGYQIVRWDEDNISHCCSPWISFALKNKKWAFLSDYIRAYVLEHYGGIYFDTDVELLKGIDHLRNFTAFGCFEGWPVLNTGGGCGAIPGFWFWKEVMRLRDDAIEHPQGQAIPFASGYFDTLPLTRRGLRLDGTFQKINDFTILPYTVFHPFDYVSKQTRLDKNTCGIHHFGWSWADQAMVAGRLNDANAYQGVLSRAKIQ